MRLLYVATDQSVPGKTGGSVHVEEVARGLAARGHEVHVVALPAAKSPQPANGAERTYRLHPSGLPFGHRFLRFATAGRVRALLDRLRVDAVMERYYNFAGEGIRAAHRRGVPSLLEVNSPLRDHPGSLKSALDALLVIRPMKRLRDEIARKADALVTPLLSIVPEEVPREKVHRVSWGANVELFRPDVEAKPLGIPSHHKVVVFSGSFRPWHGADVLARAAALVVARDPEAFFLFLGGGPSFEKTKSLVQELGLEKNALLAGAVPYEEMPSYLKGARLGVAPYQPSELAQMQLGFYWSPLKIFEYMAMALPVVTLETPPLAEIVRPGREGLLVPEGSVEALAKAIETLLADPVGARKMGASGRERVVARFSWQKHCEQLERILQGLVGTP